MMKKEGRRTFLKTSSVGLAGLGSLLTAESPRLSAASHDGAPPGFRLGMVTYQLGKDWDIETIIKNCELGGFEAVEARTTHKHGIELSLSKAQRAEVRKRFENSRVRLASLGTACEYQDADVAVVEKNIEETRCWCELAHDVGCLGVKVRPNHFVEGVPREKTIEQIGRALQKCGDVARDQGVEIWLEVHGIETAKPPYIHRIIQVANHPAVGICWNSNDGDVVDGSVQKYFDLLKPWLRNCHINELWRNPSPWGSAPGQPPQEVPGLSGYRKPYPYRELFRLMRAAGYSRYTLAEVPETCEPIRFMHYYRSLWEQLVA